MLQTIGHTITNQGNALHRQSEVAKWSNCIDNWGNSPTEKRMCTTYLLSIVCKGRVINKWIFQEHWNLPFKHRMLHLKIHSLKMNILKDITNLFSLLNRVYKCDYILMVLLIKTTSTSFAKERWPRNYWTLKYIQLV